MNSIEHLLNLAEDGKTTHQNQANMSGTKDPTSHHLR
jgi:hypothetical protein